MRFLSEDVMSSSARVLHAPKTTCVLRVGFVRVYHLSLVSVAALDTSLIQSQKGKPNRVNNMVAVVVFSLLHGVFWTACMLCCDGEQFSMRFLFRFSVSSIGAIVNQAFGHFRYLRPVASR